jgi:muramoyltetrapeptide carboxypeptidase
VSAASGWLLPRALRPGDLLGVAAPSGAVEAASLAAGSRALEGLGFRVRVSERALERELFAAGGARRRADELHALFEDPEVAGVMCARGGAGAMELLEHLQPLLFRRNPKAFVGYSDATLLHSFLNRLGLVTFHGPMVATELGSGSYDAGSFARALGDGRAPWSVEAAGTRTLRAGEARGRLRGGCLSLLAAASGTGWEQAPPDAAEGAILLLEDAKEPPYRLHRLITQLAQSGALRGVGGIVFAEMRGCEPAAEDGYSLEDVLLHALDGFEGPVALGLPSGHSATPMLTLPLGAPVRLVCGPEARLEVEGPWLS